MKTKNASKKAAKKVAKKSASVKTEEKVDSPAPSEEKKTDPVKPPDCCVICRFFKPIDDKRGQCRRYPFRPGIPQHPTTSSDDWCGEFQKVS